MVAGHLQEKKGNYYIVLNYKVEKGKRKTKWIATGLPIKGNKKRAEGMLQDARKNFEIPSESVEEEIAPPVVEEAATDEQRPTGILFADFMLEWLEVMKYQVEVTTHAAYSFNMKGKIVRNLISHFKS
ncbi:hypothetical protein [Cohnella sp.]|uniref:hypothetical protein n=1 Tax=Cohnella sp. TaxID=1883426 RepID=UPI0037044C97